MILSFPLLPNHRDPFLLGCARPLVLVQTTLQIFNVEFINVIEKVFHNRLEHFPQDSRSHVGLHKHARKNVR
jgi:hypothetical protein